jgi:siroheme synthase (precorrin-2 oxidase/ferrochelatase)
VAEEWARTDPAEAERVARTITDPQSRASTLAKIAEVAAGPDPAMAERLARTITFPWDWARALRFVAGSLIERSPGRALELLDEVERFVRMQTDPQERANGLCANAVVLVKHDPGRAVELMAEAERLLAPTATGHDGGLFERYLNVKEALLVMAAFAPAEVERFVRDLVADADRDDRVSMVTTVIADLAEGAPAAAERVAHTLSGQNLPSFRVDRFIGTLAEQDPAAAERIIRSVVTREEWGHPLCAVARTLAEREPRRAGELLAEAEQLIRGHGQPATGLAAVAGVLARLDPSRATRLLTEAEHLVRAGLDAEKAGAWAKDDVFRRSPEVLAGLWQTSSLRAIAAEWAELDPAYAAELLTEVAHRDDHRSFSYVVVDETIKTLARKDSAAAVRVARLLDGYDQEKAFEDVIAVLATQDHRESERIARTITDPERLSQALRIVVEALVGRDLAEAERVARSVPEPHSRIHMLGFIAVSLARA